MAKDTKKRPEELTEQELSLQLHELEKQQTLLRQIRLDKVKQQSEQLVADVKKHLQEAAELVNRYRDAGLDWQWTDDYNEILHELALQTSGPKVVPLDEEFLKELKSFLANKTPQTKEQIVNGILDSEGKPKYSKPTVNFKLGPIQRDGLVVLSKDGRTNLYSLKD